MKRCLFAFCYLLCTNVFAEVLYLECKVQGKSFDHKYDETIAIKIDQGLIDIVSEEFSMFGPVSTSDNIFTATKKFTSKKGVKYFFSIQIDRATGMFSAYETAALPDRKIHNTTGSGPCTKSSEARYEAAKPTQSRQPVRIIIRNPEE